MKRHFERIEINGDLLLPLREYPVREVLAVYTLGGFGETGELLESEFYRVIPDLEAETGEGPEDTVYSLLLSPTLCRERELSAVKAVYRAGYSCGEAPSDLASACLELAAFVSFIHGLYPLAYPTKKQVDAMALAGREYTAPDFKESYYHCVSLLLSEF